MTIAAYQTLYESSIAFGMRKALQGEQGKQDMENKVHCLIVCMWSADSPRYIRILRRVETLKLDW